MNYYNKARKKSRSRVQGKAELPIIPQKRVLLAVQRIESRVIPHDTCSYQARVVATLSISQQLLVYLQGQLVRCDTLYPSSVHSNSNAITNSPIS